MSTICEPQSSVRELTGRRPNAFILSVIGALVFLTGLCCAYVLRVRMGANQDTVNATNRFRLVQLVSVNSLGCRRYEKDYCLNLGDKESRDAYRVKWARTWTRLDKSINSLCQSTSNSESSQDYIRWQNAIRRYRNAFFVMVRKTNEGTISNPEKANQSLIPAKNDIRQVIRESQEHSSVLEVQVDNGRIRLANANIVLITGILGCVIVVACITAWLIWSARRSAAQERTVAKYIESKGRAEAANRLKSEFLANMSHEIRTPMTAILGFADILLGSVVKPTDVEAVNTIRRNGRCLLSLINDILDISKIEAGKLDLEKVACSPHQIIADVASLMRVRSTAKGLALGVHFDGAIPKMIQSDPTRLRQVLLNVVSNAIKFTEVGSIQILTRLSSEVDQEPTLRIDVVDTGVGISQATISKLFMPFTQADSSTTRKFGGTGLGLTIGKRLMKALGGELSVSSTVGQGSTFSISLPVGPLDKMQLVRESVESAVGKVDSQTEVSLTAPLLDRHILLAEDGADNQRLIMFVLKKAGAKVVVAENGQIAVDLAQHASDEGTPFDVILMDMQMPVLDGYSATRKLRDEGYRGPIIALTAHAMTSDRRKCLNAGCDDYATKPIDRENLISSVAQYAAKQHVDTAHDAPVA